MTDLEKLISDFEKDGLTLTTSNDGFNHLVITIHNHANDKYHRRTFKRKDVVRMTDELLLQIIGEMKEEVQEKEVQPPYSEKDYQDAKSQGLDLDNWNDYERYYQLGEQEEY